jgi:predicted dehydrogenase
MNEKLRIGVIGGGVGRNHIRACKNLSEMYDVVAVCDIDETRVQRVAAKYGIPQVFTDAADVWRADDVDVVDICTPSNLHVQQCLEALDAGKHVVCEKPIAGSLQDIDKLIRAEAASGKRLMPVFQYRFGRGVQKLKFLIEEGVAGRAYLSTLETAWRRRAPYYATWHGRWETELGGALVTLAIHAHDVLYHLLGPARKVAAHTATLVNAIETEDCAVTALEMADGSLASLSVTTGSAKQISRYRFCFSNLTAESSLQPYGATNDPWIFTGDSPELEREIEETLARFEPQPEGFEGLLTGFYRAVQEGTDLAVSLDDARDSLELITAIYHASETEQSVELPISDDHAKYAGWQP